MCSSADWETSSLYKVRLGHLSRPRDHDRQLSSFDEVGGGQDGSLSDPGMQWETKRLDSFRHWPSYAFENTDALAKAGFFYTKIRDQVKCFCCGVVIASWKAKYDPVKRHAHKSPGCPLVQSYRIADKNAFPGSPSLSSTLSPSAAVKANGTPRQSRNGYPASSFSEVKLSTELPSGLSLSNSFANKVKVSEPLPTSPASENGSISSTVSSSVAMGAGSPINSMDNVSMRLSTFFEKGWPAGSPVTPEDLSENGFYCLGKGDAVRCYICSVTLKGWEVGDTAEGEHRRHSPMCPLVTSKSKVIDSATLPSALSATAINPAPHQHGSKDMSLLLDDTTTDMASEGNRRDSFFLQKWIQGLGISNPADAFAKAGFYSTRQSDLVKCFHCGLIIDGWSRGMKPLDEHLKRSPSCSFVSATRERQAESAKAARSPSDNGYMTSFEERFNSFIFWPHSDFISPNDLAEAGLYYTGQGDAAQCFWCHGVLRRWQKGDVPWKEHAIHFGKRCQFVKKYAPAEIAVSHAGYDKALPTKASSPLLSELVLPSDVRAGLQSDSASSVEDMEITLSVVRDDDELLQRVLAEGVSRQLAERLITSHRQKSDKPYSYNEFMEDYYSAEEEKLASEVSFESSAIRKMLGGDSAMFHSNTDLESSVEELKTLRDSRLCKVCMNRDANVVFIPCGHISCCQLCASSLTVCPICRCKFTNKVTAFFS